MARIYNPNSPIHNRKNHLSLATDYNFNKLCEAKETLIKTRIKLGKHSPGSKFILTIIKYGSKIFSKSGVDSELLKKINKEVGCNGLNAKFWDEDIDYENFLKGRNTHLSFIRQFKSKNKEGRVIPEIRYKGNIINFHEYHGYGIETVEYDKDNIIEIESHNWYKGKKNKVVKITSKGYIEQELRATYDKNRLLSCSGTMKKIGKINSSEIESRGKKLILEERWIIEYSGEFTNENVNNYYGFKLDEKNCTEKKTLHRRLKEGDNYLTTNELNSHLEWTDLEEKRVGKFENGEFIEGTKTVEYSKDT